MQSLRTSGRGSTNRGRERNPESTFGVLLLIVRPPLLAQRVFQIADRVLHTVEVRVDGVSPPERLERRPRFPQTHVATRQSGLRAEMMRIELQCLLAI